MDPVDAGTRNRVSAPRSCHRAIALDTCLLSARVLHGSLFVRKKLYAVHIGVCDRESTPIAHDALHLTPVEPHPPGLRTTYLKLVWLFFCSGKNGIIASAVYSASDRIIPDTILL